MALFVQCKDARLLIWRAADEEQAMIGAFFAKECEAESAETPDIFSKRKSKLPLRSRAATLTGRPDR